MPCRRVSICAVVLVELPALGSNRSVESAYRKP